MNRYHNSLVLGGANSSNNVDQKKIEHLINQEIQNSSDDKPKIPNKRRSLIKIFKDIGKNIINK